ncbi:leucine-rich repeat protein 1-like [Camellia sinensis]|uniref:leucine-rich repeat protein 1-like n=1 Tax=Camellia sinensis TaxID=4442 RepID=UPI0010355148|nr:leucine-rich repeat protein 1-like [Camellia sinensis]
MAAPKWFWSVFAALTFFLTIVLNENSIMVCGNNEGDALVVFKLSLLDPNNVLHSWDSTIINPCTWFHIICNQNQQVILLDLGSKNLTGNLVPELGNLQQLQYLVLHQNNIQGSIPAELGNLKNLIELDLYQNNLSGKIPPSLGNLKSLEFLRLNDNHLSGKIPQEVLNLSHLKILNVTNTNLEGKIPSTRPLEDFPLKNMATSSLGIFKFVFPFLNVFLIFFFI